MKLKDILLRQGTVDPAGLATVGDIGGSDEQLGQALVQQGLLQPNDLLRAVAEQYHCDWLLTIPPDALDPELVQGLPVDYARKRNMVPLWINHGEQRRLGLAVANPADHLDLGDAILLLGQTPELLVAPEAEVQNAIETVYFHVTAPSRSLDEGPSERPRDAENDLLRSSDDAPVTRLVNHILLDALKSGASDIHIEPFPRRVRLRFRVDGILRAKDDIAKSLEPALVSRLKIMARLDIAEKRLPQDGMARVTVGEREIDIRVSTIPVAEGERVVLRLLRHDTALLGLEQLGMPAAILTEMRRLIREPHGVIWVTGPTGSGKTTTLYSALQEVDTQGQNVLTIEDPIEYQLPDIGQIGVKPKIGLTFAAGLRSILRQDPDIVLVGETRDIETAEIVVQASLTGHLVFSTLHTNTALGAILRLTDLGIQPYLVAESCKASMAQRLVRRLNPDRSNEIKVERHHTDQWGTWSEPLLGETIQIANDDDSYEGRLGVFELVPFTQDIQAAIRDRAPLSELATMTTGSSLADDCLAKIRVGQTDPAEVARVLSAV